MPQVRSVSLAFKYEEPYTTSIIPKNGPTAGGYFVEASGYYFGTADYSPLLKLENRMCEATIWVSDTFALCKVPEIERTVLTAAIITVASQTARPDKNVLFAYNAPKITSIFYSNGPTTGGTMITLFGEQFGLEDNILASRIGPSSTNTTEWNSDSIISVLIAPGVGRIETFLLSIIKIEIEYNNLIAEEPAFVFDKPSIANLNITVNGPVAGGSRLTLQVTRRHVTTCNGRVEVLTGRNDMRLTLQGANFGTSPIGWDFDGCMRYRNPDDPDVTQCVPGDSLFFGPGWTRGLVVEWVSDTQVTRRHVTTCNGR